MESCGCSNWKWVADSIHYMGEQKLQRLNYSAAAIYCAGYEKCSALEALISSLEKFDKLIKSASYSLHEVKYNLMRTQIMTHAKSIAQDDTGVPYKYYEESEWVTKFFGIYKSPIPVFKQIYQREFHQKF